MRWYVPFSMFLLFLGFAIWAILWARTKVFNLSKEECEVKANWPSSCQQDSSCCAVWDEKGKMCLKGTVESNMCVSNKSKGPLITAVISSFFFIAMFVTGIMALKSRSDRGN